MNLDIIARRIELFPGQPDPEPIRLRTLILLRWAAITGQLAAVCGGLLIGVRFPLVAVLTIIAGIKANEGQTYRYPLCWRLIK